MDISKLNLSGTEYNLKDTTAREQLNNKINKTELKTINGQTLIGSGNITIQGGTSTDLSNYYTKQEIEDKINLKLDTSVYTTDKPKFALKTEIPTKLPANGGNSQTVNNHTVESNVPANAKFTDTIYTHPTTAGNKHIPEGGNKGQILVNNGDGTAVWKDRGSELTGLEDLYSYGVEWDITVGDPHLTRIGNPLLHKSLPIQSGFKGCVAKGKNVIYYLDATDWSKKEGGTEPSVLDGTDGTVRVDTGTKFYGKSGSSGNKRWVRVSTTKIDDTWVEIPRMLIDAYRCTVDTRVSNTPKALSVVNTTAQFRGGSNRTDKDSLLSTDIFRTDLGKPRTSLPRSTMRTYATNAGSELLCYEYYKWIFYWLPVIEYANFNFQETYKDKLTSEGYKQGFLGASISNMVNWYEYNGNNPLTPCGYGNDIGNGTEVKDLVIPEFNYNKSSIRFNSWTPNSAICTSSNGSDNSKVITEVKAITDYAFYHNPDNVWGTTTYHISGLTGGQKVIFKEKQNGSNYATATILKEVTQDGEVTINWGEYNKNSTKYVGFSMVQQGCNIKIYNSNVNTTTITRPSQTLQMHRWRGFDNIFGDIWTNLDGTILLRPKANQPSNVYTTTDPKCFGDTDEFLNKMTIAGVEVASNGHIKQFDLGTTAEIIPSVMGGGTTTYKCDYHWCDVVSTEKQTLLVGGSANDGSGCGGGALASFYDVGYSVSHVGYRTLNII